MKRAAAAEVIKAFKDRGFTHLGQSPAGWFRLTGSLTAAQANQVVPCEVQLDPRFASLPKIRLLAKPDGLPAAVPHLGPDGALCYLAQNAVVLDIFDPVGQMLACLRQAEVVLDKILLGELVEDLAEEFFAYWGRYSCHVDIESAQLGEHQCLVGEARGKAMLCITDDEERSARKLAALDFKITGENVLTFRVKTDAQPRPWAGVWPPSTVSEMLNWQSTLDPRCRRKIHERIQEGFRRKALLVLVLIESPLLTYGIVVRLDEALAHSHLKILKSRKGKKAKAKRLRLAERGDPTLRAQAQPLWLVRIDNGYIACRSVPKLTTLAGLNIAVVGCGTIGGHLADALLRMGAGTLGGRMTLIDLDNFGAQNIGRHRLGFSSIDANKASALKAELERALPTANLRALPVDVREAELGELDLLIDATGEESLGHWLSEKHVTDVPILTIWIEGPGTAVRGLLRHSQGSACFRCLWHYARQGDLGAVVGDVPTLLAGYGCDGIFVPFPGTVSLHAASLGAEMAVDWVNGVSSPTLRTRVLDRNFELATPDCNPVAHKDCPVCHS